MSATKPQTKAEQFLIEESESLSQLLYNKPFADLDEARQQLMMKPKSSAMLALSRRHTVDRERAMA